MGMPAARLTDMHLCTVPAPPPATPLPPPGAPNPILVPAGPITVMIGKLFAARMGDMAPLGVPHPIAKGSATVMINKLPAARVGDTVGCGGVIIPPCCPTVLIGG